MSITRTVRYVFCGEYQCAKRRQPIGWLGLPIKPLGFSDILTWSTSKGGADSGPIYYHPTVVGKENPRSKTSTRLDGEMCN